MATRLLSVNFKEVLNLTVSMSSAVASGSRSSRFPDIYNPQKQRKTPKFIPEKLKELKSICPDEEKSTFLTDHDIAQFRKPLRHNICIELLCAGFHRTFAQLFALLQRWDTADAHAHKLETLQRFLTRAETAERAGQYGEVYDNHLCLARFFTDPEDEWLKHRFFELALHAARKFKMDCGKIEAKANLHMGQVHLEKGQLELAQDHYEAFYHMTVGRSWQDSRGHSYHSRSCDELGRVYTLQGEKLLQNKDYELAIKMLTKAHEMAKESGDPQSKGETAYRLGLAYQCIEDQTTAKQFLSVYLEISTALEDMDHLGRAYGAIAKSLESEGKQTEAIQYLEKFAEISTSSKSDRNLENAYTCLGSILNSRRQYEESCVYYERAYQMACNMESVSRLKKTQVCVGTSRALSMLQAYNKHIKTSRRQSIQKVIKWKEKREDSFSETIEKEIKK